MTTKLIFAYTALEIMPPYINISQHSDGKIYAMIRSAGARDVSEIEIPYEQLAMLQGKLVGFLSGQE